MKSITEKNLIGNFGITYNQAHIIVELINDDSADVDDILDKINVIIKGYGVESLTSEQAWNNYYNDIFALYINMGDSYAASIVYDVEEHEFSLISLGDFYESSKYFESACHCFADDDDTAADMQD
jgi:hypothetical protein